MRLVSILVLGALFGVLVVGCGGAPAGERGGPTAEPGDLAGKVPMPLPGPNTGFQEVTIKIVGHGAAHINDVALPANIAVRPDLPVRVTIYNYTADPHTFHSSDLGLAEVVLAGTPDAPRTVSFTFTPGKWGVFRWSCFMCDHAEHPMEGAIYAIMAV